jgi:nucleoside-diphosphate-sugar epimerase
MRVLIAGVTGAIGIPLTRALLTAGHDVVGLSRTATEARAWVTGAELLTADILDRRALLAAADGLQADAVVHEATALKKLPMRHRDMALTNELRVKGTANLLEVARAVGARRFVTQSMIYGYGFGDHGMRALTESDPFAPSGQGAFEATLAAMRSTERQAFTAEGIEGTALRYGIFYGPGAGLEAMVDMMRRRRLAVPRDGGGVVPLVYIDDAAAATVSALERGQSGHAYNIVDDHPVTWGEFLGAVAAAFGTPPPRRVPRSTFRLVPYAHAMMTGSWRVSNLKAKTELNWTPTARTFREGLAQALHAIGRAA